MLVTCIKCLKQKYPEEFYKRKTVKSGHSPRCKECLKVDQKIFRAKRKEERAVKVYPKFKCPDCHTLVSLDFDPLKDFTRWSFFNCPNCKENVEA